MPSILHLPYELVLFVIHHLDLSDISRLSRSCRRFQFLVREASIPKGLLESKAPFSTEALDARLSKAYAAELRRLIKRREAVASVSPYLVAVVGFANEWLYENGVLCYSRGLQLRFLHLHHSANEEIVVDLRNLLRWAFDSKRTRQQYKLSLLYYAHNIVSSVYSQAKSDAPGCRHWLLLINICDGRLIEVREIEPLGELFVRNNERFIYFGTTEADDDGYNQWIIRAFDIKRRRWLGRSLTIPYSIGTDIGSTVCFEIFDGYFYGLSNQRTLDVEEVDWLSYYSCFRFPVTSDGFDHLEEPPARQLWRRDHTEGPIDDRWTFLRMTKNEASGGLMAVELRHEWLAGRITPRRTYYTTPLSFDGAHKLLEDAEDIAPEAKIHEGEFLRRRPRDPHLVHVTDKSLTGSVTLTKCPVRSYHPACQTLLDLVNDSSSFDPRDQRLRLRGDTRSLRSPTERPQRDPPPAEAATEKEQDHDTLMRQIDELYETKTGICWPPEPDAPDADAALADLYEVLNPPGYLGGVHGSWDERSMVYATGGSGGGLRALVFVSFDPSIYLTGTPAYPGCPSLGGVASSFRAEDIDKEKRKGKGKGTAGRDPTRQPGTPPSPGCGGADGWGMPSGADEEGNRVFSRKVEPAMYREIGRGYHFAS